MSTNGQNCLKFYMFNIFMMNTWSVKTKSKAYTEVTFLTVPYM